MVVESHNIGKDYPGDSNSPFRDLRTAGTPSLRHISLNDWSLLSGRFVFVVDENGDCLACSDNARSVLGIAVDSLVGRNLKEFERKSSEASVGSCTPFVDRLFSTLTQDGLVTDFEFDWCDSNGITNQSLLCGRVLNSGSSETTEFLFSAVDRACVEASRTERGSFADSSGNRKDYELFDDTIGGRIHNLNNSLTALHCEWELANNAHSSESEPAVPSAIAAIVHQLTEEFRGLTRAYVKLRAATNTDY